MTADFDLGLWRVRPSRLVVERDGESRSLGPKAMGVLVALVEARGEPVSKDELIARAWEGDVASDEALTTVVYELRKALDDDARRPTLVGTVRARGYRLLVEIEEPTAETAVEKPTLSPPGLGGIVGMFVFAVLLLLGVGYCFGGDAERPDGFVLPDGAVSPPVAAAATIDAPRTSPIEPEATGDLEPDLEIDLEPEAGQNGIQSVTVLPFDTAGDPVDRDAFADGLAERLAIFLARGDGAPGGSPLDVVPAFSRAVAGTPLATRLMTDAVVEGSVRRADDRLWVAVQLVDTSTGWLVWGGTWEREIEDAFVLQEELARTIAKQIHDRLGSDRISENPRKPGDSNGS